MYKLVIMICYLVISVNCSFSQNKSALSKKHPEDSSLILGQPSETVLKSYTGVYQLTTDKNRTITITSENDYLLGEISGQASLPLVFKSVTKFEFEGATDASCEFVSEKGKVVKIVVFQKGKFIWRKIK